MKRRPWLHVAALLALALSGLGCGKLDPFLYSPRRTPAYEFPAEGKTAEETVQAEQIESVAIPVNAEVTLGAVYVKASQQPALAQAIYFHGQGGHIGEAFHHVKRLANVGFDTLAVDYRGWGTSSDVKPSEAGIEEDTRAALLWLRARAPSGPVVYYGLSLGTAIATQRAELDPPAVLVLESGFASIEEMTQDSSDMDLPFSFVAKDSWSTSTRLRGMHVPVLLMHGTADDYVRPEFSQTLYANANHPKKLVLVEGAVHGNVPRVMGFELFQKTLLDFAKPHLR